MSDEAGSKRRSLRVPSFVGREQARRGLAAALERALKFEAPQFVTVLAPLHRHFKLLGVPLYFCTLNAAVLLGMREVVRGRGYAVWETVRR